MRRGEIYELQPSRSHGREQRGRRFGVVVQADELLPRSMVIVAPTSQSAKPASFRPDIEIQLETTRVLVEQLGAVDVGRLGASVGHVTPEEQWGIDDALKAMDFIPCKLPQKRGYSQLGTMSNAANIPIYGVYCRNGQY